MYHIYKTVTYFLFQVIVIFLYNIVFPKLVIQDCIYRYLKLCSTIRVLKIGSNVNNTVLCDTKEGSSIRVIWVNQVIKLCIWCINTQWNTSIFINSGGVEKFTSCCPVVGDRCGVFGAGCGKDWSVLVTDDGNVYGGRGKLRNGCLVRRNNDKL